MKEKNISQELMENGYWSRFWTVFLFAESSIRISAWVAQKQVWKDQVAKADLYSKVDPSKNWSSDRYFSALHLSFIAEM